MPVPKSADVGFTDPDLAVISSTLRHLESFQPNWKAINEDLKVKNAPRDFRKALKKLGLEINKGAVVEVGEGESGSTPPAAAAPKTVAGKAKVKASHKKANAPEKKRNASEAGMSEDEDRVNEDKKLKPEAAAAKE